MMILLLCLKKKTSFLPEGVLYQDEIIRIGFKSEYSKGMGRMMLYYINLTNQQLTGFRTFVPATSSHAIQLQPTASLIDPRGQLQQLINVACLNPYADPPTLQVGFVYNGKSVNFNLRLPLLMIRFMEPFELNGPEFFQQWKLISPGPPLEQQSVIKANTTIDLAALGKSLANTFHLAILKGVDPNINNLVCVGLFYNSAGPITCMIRVESNPNAMMYRITLRTPNQQISIALKELLVTFLG